MESNLSLASAYNPFSRASWHYRYILLPMVVHCVFFYSIARVSAGLWLPNDESSVSFICLASDYISNKWSREVFKKGTSRPE